MGQITGNYKGSEFRYLGGCWSYPLRGHVYGPGLATPKQFSTETEMEFPAGANCPLPVELGRPPLGPLTFQRALRDASVTHLPHCAELQSDTWPPPAFLGATVGVSPNLPALQQPAWSPFTVKARTCLASHLEGKSPRPQECQPPVSVCPLQTCGPSPGEGRSVWVPGGAPDPPPWGLLPCNKSDQAREP